MSVYYDVREHVVLKNKAVEELGFAVAENVAQIGYRMLLDRAAISKLELTVDGKEYTFEGREVTQDLHEMTRAIADASEIDMVIDYDGVNFDFTFMNAVEEILEEMPELASDIIYSVYNKADCSSGAGCLSAFGATDVVVCSGSIDSESIVGHLDGEWISEDTAVVFDDDVTEDMDVEAIKKCAHDFADIGADVDFDEKKLILFVNCITLRSADDIKRFIDIYNALDRATCGKCSYILEFVDKTQADARILELDFDVQGKSIIKVTSVAMHSNNPCDGTKRF